MTVMKRWLRWRTVTPEETETVTDRLARWPCDVGGAVRHQFALAALETYGAEALRITSDDDHWAVAVVFPGRLVVPCGDPEAASMRGTSH